VKEKIGIVETPHLGMEHQTMNAYGNKFRYTQVGGKDFDWLLTHEFGHEWWGNKVTVKDWADYWIHEGICNFGDVLYTRELEGESAYLRRFQQMALNFRNQKPIIIGKDIDEETAYHDDIYGKGAFFMHTLRYVIGDSIFSRHSKNLLPIQNIPTIIWFPPVTWKNYSIKGAKKISIRCSIYFYILRINLKLT
jgi:aminopeptidase N